MPMGAVGRTGVIKSNKIQNKFAVRIIDRAQAGWVGNSYLPGSHGIASREQFDARSEFQALEHLFAEPTHMRLQTENSEHSPQGSIEGYTASERLKRKR